MASILLLVAKQARQNETVRRLQHAGHRVVTAEPRHPDYAMAADSMRPPPDAIVVEGSFQPYKGAEAAAFLHDTKALRAKPVIFYNLRPADEPMVRSKLPEARIVPADGLAEAVAATSGA